MSTCPAPNLSASPAAALVPAPQGGRVDADLIRRLRLLLSESAELHHARLSPDEWVAARRHLDAARADYLAIRIDDASNATAFLAVFTDASFSRLHRSKTTFDAASDRLQLWANLRYLSDLTLSPRWAALVGLDRRRVGGRETAMAGQGRERRG